MNKEQIDRLYHLMRMASNIVDEELPTESLKATGLTPAEEVDIFFGLARHLFAGGDYSALVRYSAYYGQRFLVDPVHAAIKSKGWEFNRIAEFGAGLSWLGRDLAAKFGTPHTLFIDKRRWSMIDVIADLETDKGRQEVLDQLEVDDLIVMSDFLHCVDSPREVLEPFSEWPMAILEYFPISERYRVSYAQQIKRYGCRPLVLFEEISTLTSRKTDIVELDPYILMLIEEDEV